MRSVLKWTAVLLVILAGVAAVWFGYERYEHRFVRNDADMVKLLPPGADVTTFFIDLAALRKAGLLHLITGITPAATEKDYADFIAATDFDYARDLDALAGGVNDNSEIFFILRGRFNWAKLSRFALAHGGSCDDDACRAPGSKPHRWVNFVRIQPDTIALAISASSTAADLLLSPGRRLQELPLSDPIWLRVSSVMLKDPTALPKALQIFAISLQGADWVLLYLGGPTMDEAFTVQLEAAFPNAPSADTTCKQLQIQTKMLRLELAHETNDLTLRI